MHEFSARQTLTGAELLFAALWARAGAPTPWLHPGTSGGILSRQIFVQGWFS